MIVTRNMVGPVIARLRDAQTLSFDTETTGLRPYHGDRLFSVVLASRSIDGKIYAFYFNFIPYEGLPHDSVLLPEHLQAFKELFSDPSKTWYAHNAKFDLAMLAREGIEVAGTVHCTQAIERVVFNDHTPGTYDLASCAHRIGVEKDCRVEDHLKAHNLWDWSSPDKPGAREKNYHYDRVPFDIIAPYGERDAEICLSLGEHQEKELQKVDGETQEEAKKKGKTLPSVLSILENEKRLTATVFRLERVGVRIDRPYCLRAASYESDRADQATIAFKRETGRDFSASGKLFQTVFASDRERWGVADKGGPSFTSEVLQNFLHPAAAHILAYRDAKSRCDFYRGFLYHADANGDVHPNYNPAGAATGRFSSSGPNFQNLTSEEGEELNHEFVVRRAIIPRPGFVFYGRDFNAMEYRLMFEYACIMWGSETELVKQIKAGKDPHQATADLVTSMGRMILTRKVAKNGNFAELYGSGLDTLAATIKGTRAEAQTLKDALREAAPEVRNLVNKVSTTARTRGFIRNWAGRRSYLRDANLAYKMTNYLIQGGCADVNKFALNRIDQYLLGKKSRLIMTIHDEAVLEMHESEASFVPAAVKEIMDTVYIGKYLSLTSSGYTSTRSLADLEDSA